MITPKDIQKWQQAEQGINKLLNELSSEELQAYQKLSELFKNQSFQTNECQNYLPKLTNAMRQTKNRLLKAHLTNLIALSEKYFAAKAANTNIPTPQPKANPVQETPPIATPIFEIPTYAPPQPQKTETPKIEQPKAERKPKSKFKIVLFIIIALLLIGSYYVDYYWDTISEKFFSPKIEIISETDSLNIVITDTIVVIDNLADNITELSVDTVQSPDPVPAPAPIQKPPVKKSLTNSEIVSLFSDVSIGDNEALERFIKEVGTNIKVEGAENIDNSYELAHDAFLYDRNYSISIQRNSNGTISKIIVE